jgi:hypothetical protein
VLSSRAITIVAALSITLVRLPFYFQHKSLLDPLTIGVFVLCVGWGVSRQRRGSFVTWAFGLMFLYAAVISVALFRGADQHVYGSLESAVNQSAIYLLFVAFGVILISTARDQRERNERLLAIALAPAVYVTINALMNLAGLQSPEPGGLNTGSPAELLQFLGIPSDRTKFPMATSVNLFSIVASAALASVVVLRTTAPQAISRAAAWAIGAACVYCLLLGDSRGALVIAVIVAVILVTNVRIPAKLIACTIPLLPFIILGATALISGTGLDHALSRGTGRFEEVATATGRLFIWKGSWEVLRHFGVQQLYGWGAAGHVTSGASARYAYVFPGNATAETVFTHDIDLQMIFDTGYAGLAVYVLAVGVSWYRLQRFLRLDPKSPAVALVAILLVIVLSGATEVSPTYYSQEALLATLMIMGASTALPRGARPRPPTATDRSPIKAGRRRTPLTQIR